MRGGAHVHRHSDHDYLLSQPVKSHRVVHDGEIQGVWMIDRGALCN